MSARVLLNLLNELGKSDKMRGLSSILSLFPNSFNRFNNIGARMTLKLFCNRVFDMKRSTFCHIRNVLMSVIS